MNRSTSNDVYQNNRKAGSRFRMARVLLCAGLFTALVGCVPATVTPDTDGAAPADRAPVDLVIYSPAPPQIMLHQNNVAAAEMLAACDTFGTVDAPAVALPDSINTINALPAGAKETHLPIVTPLDFQTAIDQSAPDWHAYERENADLKFVSSLYEVTYGVMVFDEAVQSPEDLKGLRIAVPARPSSVRWFSEVLLRDGWDILDDVSLVSLAPPEVPDALANGEIDAVAWNIMSQSPQGFEPLLPMLFAQDNARWLSVDADTLARINAANPFETSLVDLEEGDILTGGATPSAPASLLSFKQALAAWDDTPEDVVEAIVACLGASPRSFGAGKTFAEEQFDWPGLSDEVIHRGAR